MMPTAMPAPASTRTLRLMLHASSGVSSSLSGLKTSWCVLQREPQPGEVRQQQHDRDRERHVLDVGREVRRLVLELRQLAAVRQQEHRRQQQRDRGQQQHRGLRAGRLGDELLPLPAPAADQHRGAHHQQQVAEDRADDRRLDDLLQPRLEREQGDDQLRRVAERDVQQAADAGPGAVRELLGGAAHQRRGRHDAERRGEEDQDRIGVGQIQDDRDDDERDEQIRPARPAEQEAPQVEGLGRRSHRCGSLRELSARFSSSLNGRASFGASMS